jgi:hemerythrin-like metal-binding protein
MDSAFQWNTSYSVKVEAMDAQHKRLFEIIRELYTAMRAGQGKQVVGEVLHRLIEYTVQHFAAEEKLMEKNGYQLLAAHRIEHKTLTDKVVAFKKDFETFLQDWLTHHIQDVDQKYGAFLNSKGLH